MIRHTVQLLGPLSDPLSVDDQTVHHGPIKTN